jgi:hypothetical protein
MRLRPDFIFLSTGETRRWILRAKPKKRLVTRPRSRSSFSLRNNFHAGAAAFRNRSSTLLLLTSLPCDHPLHLTFRLFICSLCGVRAGYPRISIVGACLHKNECLFSMEVAGGKAQRQLCSVWHAVDVMRSVRPKHVRRRCIKKGIGV